MHLILLIQMSNWSLGNVLFKEAPEVIHVHTYIGSICPILLTGADADGVPAAVEKTSGHTC